MCIDNYMTRDEEPRRNKNDYSDEEELRDREDE